MRRWILHPGETRRCSPGLAYLLPVVKQRNEYTTSKPKAILPLPSPVSTWAECPHQIFGDMGRSLLAPPASEIRLVTSALGLLDRWRRLVSQTSTILG